MLGLPPPTRPLPLPLLPPPQAAFRPSCAGPSPAAAKTPPKTPPPLAAPSCTPPTAAAPSCAPRRAPHTGATGALCLLVTSFLTCKGLLRRCFQDLHQTLLCRRRRRCENLLLLLCAFIIICAFCKRLHPFGYVPGSRSGCSMLAGDFTHHLQRGGF